MKNLFTFYLFIGLLSTIYSQEIEITFESDGLTLEGTLALPQNVNTIHPVAILVHGSGPSNRNQDVVLAGPNASCLYPQLLNRTIANFRDISDHLVSEGIAVLRYDKRTFTHRDLDEPEIVVDDFIDDVESAIQFCLGRNDIDHDQIYLIGHSQGSAMIPIAAKNSNAVRGLISLAGATTPIDTIFAEQWRRLFTICENDPATGENVANQLYRQFTKIREGQFPLEGQISIVFPTLPPFFLGYGKFWKSWIDVSNNVVENYKESGLKSLIIQGEDDFNVPFGEEEDFRVFANAEVKTYPGINHFLTTATDPSVDKEILYDISSWINGCITSVITTEEEAQNVFTLNRENQNLFIQSRDYCQRCTVKEYAMSGHFVQSTSFNGHEIYLPISSPAQTIIVIEDQGAIYSYIR